MFREAASGQLDKNWWLTLKNEKAKGRNGKEKLELVKEIVVNQGVLLSYIEVDIWNLLHVLYMEREGISTNGPCINLVGLRCQNHICIQISSYMIFFF